MLTGVIGGLLAQGVDPFARGRDRLRTCTAGPPTRRRTAPDIVASDLVRALPRTLHALRNRRDPWET